MSAKPGRREAVAAGAALLLGGTAAAQPPVPAKNDDTLTGEWFNAGKLEQPCAVWQQGRVLILINEKGDLATGQFTEANQFSILKGWDGDLTGRVADRGKTIIWKGGGSWKRR
jgi:hypothetical protein